jgi:outer membrane protein assembly factor BamB
MLKIFQTIIISLFLGNFFCLNAQNDTIHNIKVLSEKLNQEDSVTYPIIKTFLGNWERNYYGENPPDRLDLVWKHYLGKGETVISRNIGTKEWAGAGWTGQPLLVNENDKLFLIQGAYDHHLKKINAETGELVWQYKFDDVIKGAGTIWVNKKADSLENELVILQGSRLGTGHYLDAKHIPSYRAIS